MSETGDNHFCVRLNQDSELLRVLFKTLKTGNIYRNDESEEELINNFETFVKLHNEK